MRVSARQGLTILTCTMAALFVCRDALQAETVRVRHREGLVHGFLVLKGADGSRLANGDLIQTTNGDRVTSRLVFHFHDGSLYDETTVFSERGRFRLISDHLVEKGPAFVQAIDMAVNAESGVVTVRYDDHGTEKTDSDRLQPVPDLANGLIPTLLKNVGSTPPTGLSLLVATPKPRVVRLAITSEGSESFRTGDIHRRALRFVIKAEIGGIAGALAKLLGKEPPDSHVWILEGDAPAFVKSEQPFYAGGPLWTIELASPAWARETTDRRDDRGARSGAWPQTVLRDACRGWEPVPCAIAHAAH